MVESRKVDLAKLKLEAIDFSETPIIVWWVRRFIVGILLSFYYIYAIAFVLSVSYPSFYVDSTDPAVAARELVEITKLTENHHILMMTFGFLGSVFFITRTFVRTRRTADYPVAWYLTRPLQGVLMALFIYYAFRAGQLVFYSGEGSVDPNAVNVFTLSILAIIAGMFSEQAYRKLYSIAEKLLSPKD